jgi:hypothetical protein
MLGSSPIDKKFNNYYYTIYLTQGGSNMADKPHAPELGGKGGFSGEEASNLFQCPECNAEHAFPGHKPGDPLMCPKCAIPMKAKYTK